MRKYLPIFLIIFLTSITLLVVFPIMVQGAGGIVPDCQNADGGCTWGDFILLINKFIDFLFYIAGALAAISFAYAGFLYLTSMGSPEQIKKAKSIFGKVVLGLIIALAAWLIVKVILSAVGLKQGQGYSLLGF